MFNIFIIVQNQKLFYKGRAQNHSLLTSYDTNKIIKVFRSLPANDKVI